MTPGPGPGRALVALVSSASVTTAAARLLARRPPGGPARWARTNHRGEPVSLLEGPSYVLGAAVAAATAPGLAPRLRLAGGFSTVAAGALGAYDDLAGDSVRKGLAGHLGALARGQVTTGAVKIVGLAATGVVSAVAVGTSPRPDGPRGAVSAALDVLAGGALVAATANLLNLLDLRPGRALKATLLVSTAALGGGAGAPLFVAGAGAAAAALGGDLAERDMLGDTGANAAGALLGTALLAGTGRRGRLALLAALTALTLASERVSFTRVIEGTPVLRELDALGRRPRG